MAQRREAPKTLLCLNCGAENPITAYCCLKCFKVMRPKEKVPFWKMHFRVDTTMMIIIAVVVGFGVMLVKRWIENVEAQVSMNFKTNDYNVSLVADKRKKQSLSTDADIDAIDSAPPAETPAPAPATNPQ